MNTAAIKYSQALEAMIVGLWWPANEIDEASLWTSVADRLAGALELAGTLDLSTAAEHLATLTELARHRARMASQARENRELAAYVGQQGVDQVDVGRFFARYA